MSAPAIPSRRPSPRTRRVRLAGALTGVLLAVVAGAAVAWSWHESHRGAQATEASVPASWVRPVVAPADLSQRSGVSITQVAVTGNGGLVDLRFKVLDPQRANALHDQATPPAVVDERSGLVAHELLMNHAHSGSYSIGVTYYLVFNNPGNWIHRGSRVTVLLGNAQVEHVVVR